jgi:adenosylcobinamide-GDP ribazoletransferase
MNLLRPINVAFAFLTRLPLRSRSAVTAVELGRALLWFPLVGAALGGVLVTAERLLAGRLAHGLLAVGLVAALALLTGGLHLDGLADTFDALGGGRGDRVRMLEIMRDSRIGAHGAAALCLLLMAKVFALGETLARGQIWPLFAFPIVARWAVIPLVIFFRYARPEGLGKDFHGHGRAAHLAGATALAAALLVWIGPAAIAPALAAVGVALAFGWMLDRRLGGLTGDVYGAAIELAELAFLITASR